MLAGVSLTAASRDARLARTPVVPLPPPAALPQFSIESWRGDGSLFQREVSTRAYVLQRIRVLEMHRVVLLEASAPPSA